MPIATPTDKPRWLDGIGAFLAVSVMLLVIFQTVAPYFIEIPTNSATTISIQQTMVQTVFIAIISFFFGTSIGTNKKDESISALASTAKAAQETLSATSTGSGASLAPVADTIELKAGDAVNVKAEDPVA